MKGDHEHIPCSHNRRGLFPLEVVWRHEHAALEPHNAAEWSHSSQETHHVQLFGTEISIASYLVPAFEWRFELKWNYVFFILIIRVTMEQRLIRLTYREHYCSRVIADRS